MTGLDNMDDVIETGASKGSRIGFTLAVAGRRVASDGAHAAVTDKKPVPVNDNASDSDEDLQRPKRRRILVPIEYTEQELRSIGLNDTEIQLKMKEYKKQLAQSIVQQIPTGKQELFDYEMEWKFLDQKVRRMVQTWKPSWMSIC